MDNLILMPRIFFHFLLSVIFTFVVTSLIHSQLAIVELTQTGVIVSINARLSLTIEDSMNLLPSLGVLLSISLLIAFITTTKLLKIVSISQKVLYPMAGTIAIVVALIGTHPILNMAQVTNTYLAILLYCLSGAAGGYIYYSLQRINADSNKKEAFKKPLF